MLRVLFVVLVFGAPGSQAMAEETSGYSYGAVDVGRSKASYLCPDTASGCGNSSGLIRGTIGYQFVEHIGAEVSYGYYGKQSLGSLGATSRGDWRADGYQLSAVLTSNKFRDNWRITGKLGFASTTLQNTALNHSATSTNLAAALGVRYDFSQDVGARLQYENLGWVGDGITGSSLIWLLTAGMVFKF